MAADFSKTGKSNVSRSKNHERMVAKWLSEWAGCEFRRRRVTGRDTATRMVEMTADVIPVEGEFLFSIEAKCGKDFSFDSLLSCTATCRFTQWWHQTNYDAQFAAQDQGRPIYPLLFFRPTPQQNWIAFSGKAVKHLSPKGGLASHSASLWFPHLMFDGYSRLGLVAGDVSHTKNKKIVKILLDDVVFCRWKDFADGVDPSSVITNVRLQPKQPGENGAAGGQCRAQAGDGT